MPDWLDDSLGVEMSIPPQELALRLALGAGFGGLVALVYCLSHGRRKANSRALATTLVLLSILIAMVSLVIGNSVARAFSLVGALSIVRFRTVVDDTRDTAFVIFAVIVGMAVGVGLWEVALIGIPVVGGAAIALGRWSYTPTVQESRDGTLSVRLGLGRDPELLITPVLGRHLESFQVLASATARQGAALEVTYAVRFQTQPGITALVAELNQIEGVLSVDLRRM